ncbi:MAG: hypothetical protein Q3979_02560 [Actinomycetaceae bacterium]|nr:hypothetical protein [Actinomycetaceae bacterium]
MEEKSGSRDGKRAYVRFFLVSLAMIALVVFVMWERFTAPASRGGMGVSPGAVAAVAGIAVVVSAISCGAGYARDRQIERDAGPGRQPGPARGRGGGPADGRGEGEA